MISWHHLQSKISLNLFSKNLSFILQNLAKLLTLLKSKVKSLFSKINFRPQNNLNNSKKIHKLQYKSQRNSFKMKFPRQLQYCQVKDRSKSHWPKS